MRNDHANVQYRIDGIILPEGISCHSLAAETASGPSISAPDAQAAPRESTATPGGGTMGARAIYKPMPEIPEEIRRRVATLVAVARFHVAADGAATVELIQPTPDPRFNTALLGMLRTWRFFPAMANGRPVTSSVDIRIPILIR